MQNTKTFGPLIYRRIQTASSIHQQSNSDRSLKILVVPILLKKAPNSSDIECNYTLYPIPKSSPSLSTVRNFTVEFINVWKSGLWIIGRLYRKTWNLLAMPDLYKEHRRLPTDPSPSAIQSLKKAIFDYSDSVVDRWVPNQSENLLKSIDTHAQFIHFNQKLEVPIEKVEVIFPKISSNWKWVSPYIKSGPDIPFQDHLRRVLAEVERYGKEDCQRLFHKSKLVLGITIPFYLIIPLSLNRLDEILSALFERSIEWFRGYEKLVPLPLTYNVVRMFSYHRCISTANFFSKISDIEKETIPKLKEEIVDLKKTSSAVSSENRATLSKHIKDLEASVQNLGFHYIQCADLSKCYSSLAKKVDNLSSENEAEIWIDRQSLSTLCKNYRIPASRFLKEITKSKENISRKLRIENWK